MAGVSRNIRFTLKQLQYFAAVARTGQISLAAAEVHVSQSAMTSAIAELERLLSAALLERSRTGVTLTHEGHLFLQRANAVLEAADEAARQPFRERSVVTGTLNIAASYTVLGYFLLPFIAKFQKHHPLVKIVPLEQNRTQIEDSVSNGDLEIAVALTSNMTEPERFNRVVLARSRRQLWVGPAHPLVDAAQTTLAEASAFPYILPMVDEGDISAMRYWKNAGVQPPQYIRTSSMEAVREMVALGFGTTILSDMVFRPWSLDGRRIRTVPLEDAIPTMEVGLIWKKDQTLSPVAEALRQYLKVAVSARVDD
ncbi:LysR family transcriptional regulator [Variovorax paradoxus]|nr:LysR substrate-binding domain-containing protein [Variovorax paradoxus]MBT2302504.1 LysR family transcriptional regulator [Variovorax paradoxus]MBT2324322.1 LysR family transcriptional regulator [Variovorax paradoxus]